MVVKEITHLLATDLYCLPLTESQVSSSKLNTKNFLYSSILMVHFLSSSFDPVVQTTAWPHEISGQMLSRHSIASSSRTVRPCSPWGGRWVGHWKTTGSTVCSSVPHSQAAEEAIPHLYNHKKERKRPTLVRRR